MPSKTGGTLTAHYFRPQNPTGRYVLLNHGYNYPYYGMYKYLPLFLPRGVGVLLPDHRGNGLSGRAPVPFGYYEHQDSIAWLDKLREIARGEGFENPEIGVMGESMGAAISLLMAAKCSDLAFCIADCSYTSWKSILGFRCKCDFHNLVRIFLPAAYLFIPILSGAKASRVDVLKAAESITVPTMIIHGDADRYVPYEMGRAIAASNPSFHFFTQPGAGHAQSVVKDYDTYEKNVTDFLNQTGFFKESVVTK